ncbi:UNVERIFIED_CONTAM: hypothetical protein Slati_2679900 [Sesamum latifolium]|uniref:Retrotransposon gag domain-containing protein n=1 Tax=Sesamum latifolium TaxID=2727402 RepID=A0AAW2VYI3_9LAMI
MALWIPWSTCHDSRTRPYDIDTMMGSNVVSSLPHLRGLPSNGSINYLSEPLEKDNEPLKEYLQTFNVVALEVPSATQEMKASAFSQGLLDGDFFKSLAKKPASKFDALLAQAAKYINMEDAQAAKKIESQRKTKGNEGGDPLQEAPCRHTRQKTSLPKNKRCLHSSDCPYNTSPHGC